MGLLCQLSAAMHLEHLAQSLPNTEPLIHDRKNKQVHWDVETVAMAQATQLPERLPLSQL